MDANYPLRWQQIKSRFTRRLVKQGLQFKKNSRGEYELWQRRYWEHTIRDDLDFSKHVEYIHYNPVKYGVVSEVADWPYSSFFSHVKFNLVDEGWGSVSLDLDLLAGER